MQHPAKRVLFLTFEGVGSTIFQSQVASHALEMKRHGVDVEVWATDTVPSHYTTSRQNLGKTTALGNVNVRLFRGVPWFLPGSQRLNAFLLWWRLLHTDATFDVVHARADYAASVYSLIPARWRVPLLWDCRGDWAPEIAQALYGKKWVPKPVQRLVLRLVQRAGMRAGRLCAVANFVSNKLRERKSPLLHGQPAFVTPCAVPEHMFFFDQRLRKGTRDRLGLREDDLVLIYSGALTTYQGFKAYPRLVNELSAICPGTVKLLAVTPDTVKATAILEDQLSKNQFIVMSADFSEMNALLNAADCGLLLREKGPINDVASPTKFGEYCLAGLPVIIDGHVDQALTVSRVLGNGLDAQELAAQVNCLPATDRQRSDIARRATPIFGRSGQAEIFLQMYSAAVPRA